MIAGVLVAVFVIACCLFAAFWIAGALMAGGARR